jgi:membrane protease YdiL (CAAX protease family)
MDAQHTPGGPNPDAPRRNWFTAHPVFSFFALTFAYSWSIYLVVSLMDWPNQTVLSRWLLIAAFGPSLAAIAVSRLSGRGETSAASRWRWPVFGLAFVFAGAVEAIDHVCFKHHVTIPLLVADLIMVTVAAVVISSVCSRWHGVRKTFGGLLHWRVGIGWYVVALASWPLMVLLTNWLARAAGLSVPAPSRPPSMGLALLAAESLVWYLLFNGGLTEEPGWRGLAQVKLQERFSPLAAAAIIGAFWGLWHIPMHFMGMYPFGAWGAFIRVLNIADAIIFAWLCNRTGRSLVPVLLLHSARNTTNLFLPRSFEVSTLFIIVAAAVVAVWDRMWRRPTGTEQDAASADDHGAGAPLGSPQPA